MFEFEGYTIKNKQVSGLFDRKLVKEPWNQTMRILDNPLEEYLFREKIKEAELLGQNDQAEYLIEAETGVPFS